MGVETLATAADLPEEPELTTSTVNIYTTVIQTDIIEQQVIIYKLSISHAFLAYSVSNAAAEIKCLTKFALR